MCFVGIVDLIFAPGKIFLVSVLFFRLLNSIGIAMVSFVLKL
jgi:hypothetical protein